MALKENMEDMVVTNTLTLALWEYFHFKPNSRLFNSSVRLNLHSS